MFGGSQESFVGGGGGSYPTAAFGYGRGRHRWDGWDGAPVAIDGEVYFLEWPLDRWWGPQFGPWDDVPWSAGPWWYYDGDMSPAYGFGPDPWWAWAW